MESWKPKINYNHKPTGRSKANAPCKKHPKHRQSPGVCSICLSEKLSQLTNTDGSSRAKAANSPSSSSSYLSSLSSSNASSYSSPVVNYTSRVDSEARKYMRVFKNIAGQDVLKKSRSTAFILQRRKEEDENGKNIEMKRGFWSKLWPRRNKGLMHSRTTRERVITTVH
ncbi:hypothetical protein Pfo_018865 [Paulownia fortunei]|nr:hypothetical protein Pfo_018865 [Paulownia fortunei]